MIVFWWKLQNIISRIKLWLNNFKVVTFVESMPRYPGGKDSMNEYFRKNFSYPELERNLNIEGRVLVSFTIAKNGIVKNVEVVDGLSPGLNDAAVELVRKMPRWKPGMQNYKFVEVKYTMPINFSL